jgi:hypothetical protein
MQGDEVSREPLGALTGVAPHQAISQALTDDVFNAVDGRGTRLAQSTLLNSG